jgi:hypothetical protein
VGGRPLALLAALLLATPAQAQILSTGTPTVDILLTQAIAEQRIFLTCTVLMGETHSFVTDLWTKEVATAATVLAENGVPAQVVAAFTAAAQPEALLPAPDTPFDAVRQLCAADPDWITRLNRMDMINLARALPEAFQ